VQLAYNKNLRSRQFLW